MKSNYRYLTEEQINEIVIRRESGEDIESIAKDIGCHRNTVSNITKKRGMCKSRRPYTRKRNPDNLVPIWFRASKDVVEFVDERYPNIGELFESFVRHLMKQQK